MPEAIVPTKTPWSRREKMLAYRLYVLQGLSPKEISEKVDRTAEAVSQLASRSGWVKLRKEKLAVQAKAADEAIQAQTREFVESVATQAQELAEAGFELARSAADGKEFAMAASGTKVFVQLARSALGLDAAGAAGSARAPVLAIVFGQAPDAAAAAKPVEVTAPAQDSDEDELAFAD